mgnify:CR=1 FL=1
MEAGPLDRRDEGHPPDHPRTGGALPPSRFPLGVGGADGLRGLPDYGRAGATDGDPPADRQSPDEHELRPARRLRLWHTAPIVALGVLGSLMFAFPLAFGFGDQGAVVAMLGLLLSASSAGWGIMLARQVGYTWPGLPARGSGGRPDWRFVTVYAVICLVAAVLAIWRVARLH